MSERVMRDVWCESAGFRRRLGAALVAMAVCCALAPAVTRAEVPIVPPESLGLSAEQLAKIDALVKENIEKGNLPGCVVAIGRTGGIGLLKTYGQRQVDPSAEPMTDDTVFDMASLTKPIATATSIMILVERGEVRLRETVTTYLPEFAPGGKDEITIEQLLTHHSGLIPDNPLGDYEDGVETAWENIYALEPRDKPGTKFVYSDVNFIVLGEVVRKVTGYDVAEFAAANVFRPLGMEETGYKPGEVLRRRAAPTEQRDGEWLRGEVHDPRAALLGGVAGHAGLFSTARDLAIYCDAMLRGSRAGDESPRIMSRATLAEMIRPRDVAGNFRDLGWDNRSQYSTNRGELFGPRAFGHGGFTGTSMWVDPNLDLFVIFLSNRLHPDGMGNVNPLAGRIGSIAAAAVVGPNRLGGGGVALAGGPTASGARSAKPRAAVVTGLDVFARDGFVPVRGRRVGIITNQTGVDAEGHRLIDLLHDTDSIEVTAIFSPEHGIAGQLDEDGIKDTKDEKTGVPIYSLYGEHRRPTEEQLKDIDAIVFDLQDIGARFWTYMSTMTNAMETAAEHKKRFIVLDRPNPIGGVLVEGPVLDAGRESFVGFHTVPLRHGMTVGELATMVKAERRLDVDLIVVKCENWRRGDFWDATGLAWVNPSPNMRNLTEAVLYPGIGLLETTNISVGRGTDTPFEVLGAPWIDGQNLARELNESGLAGIGFVPIEFTPDSSKFEGEKCGGVNFTILDRAAIRPVRVGLTIACTLRRLYPDAWKVNDMDRLLIDRRVLEAIRDGIEGPALEAAYQEELDAFLERRAKHLMYEE
jgi:uncharacterized protein YbbC (DUF1343 family)/CubicO group peptidase (beta-lactamase class C family)